MFEIGVQHKKKILLILLLAANSLMVYMLLQFEPYEQKKLESLAQVDSIIISQLEDFGIFEEQINTRRVTIDSNFTRKIYDVDVPEDFSKSHLHYALQKQLHRYDISTFGKVNLADEMLDIHLYKDGTVFRSVLIQTDTTTPSRRFFAHFFIRFAEKPSVSMLKEVVRFGEPVPVIVPLQPMVEFETVNDGIYAFYPRLAYQFVDTDEQLLDPWSDVSVLKQKLQQLRNIDRTAAVVLYKEVLASFSPSEKEAILNTGITFYDISSALVLTGEKGKLTFKRRLGNAIKSAKKGNIPTVIVEGNEDTLAWLHQFLPDFRRQGLIIAPPHPLSR